MSSQQTRGYLAVVAAIIIAGVLISASVLLVFTKPPETTTTTTTETITRTSTLTQPAYDSCLKQVPPDSDFSSYSNSTWEGYSVTYPNGTQAFFPLDACPVPVTPANYIVDSTIESNPKFIAAEGGFTYEATNACNCSYQSKITNSTGQYDVFNFILYSSQRLYPCGSTSYWTYDELGVLQVVIPASPTGILQFSSAQVEQGAANVFFCTTSTTT